jgi:hypothetical protein
MESERAAVVITDMPYNVPISGHATGKGKIKHREFAMAAGEMTEAEFTGFLTKVFGFICAHAVPGALIFSFMDWMHAWEMLSAGRAAGFPLLNLIVWSKTNAGMGSLYRSQHELVFLFRNGKEQHLNNIQLGRHGRWRTNVWTYPGATGCARKGTKDAIAIHPTVKSIALVSDAVLDCSRRNDVVLDPFIGSGTAILACERTYPDIKKVFLLNQDYSFGRASAIGFEKVLKRLAPNVEIVGNVLHPRGAANFSPYLQQIQASNADFVLTADWGADLVQLVSQAKSFGLKPRIGGTFLADPEILKGVGDAAIGDLGSDVYLPTLDNELNKQFVQAWHAAHANTDLPWPTASVGKSYISTELAASAIAAADSTDFDKVEKVLEGFKTDSIAGPLEVRACDHQIQLPQIAGVIIASDKRFYDFPYLGPALVAPLSAIAVPPEETGNPRCKTS